MKKNSMRLLGFLLVAVMVVSLLGLGVFAGDTANDVNDAAGNVDAQSSEADLVINSVDDLLDFAESVNSGDTYSGEIVALGSDLDLAGLNWTPIGGWDGAVQFLGEFDGNGKTIFNLTINDTDVTAAKYRSGFFADLGQGSSVHDLTFDNVTVTNTKGGQVGALSGRSGADLETILVNGFEANVASGTYAGAVVGITNYYSSGDYGFSWDDVDAKGVTIAFKGSETSYGGGLLGGMNPNGARLNTYENCDVTDVTITDENIGWHGGMWGWHGRSGAFDYVKNCSVTNVNITTSGTGDSRVGGICGFVGVSGGLFENVTVNGGNLVAGGGYAGGFTPWSYAWGQDTYKNCSVENVNVTCETGMAGGFIAAAGAGNQTSKCIDCAVVGGTVTGRIASGFAASDRVGNAGGAYILNGCTSSAAVTGTEYAAGLIARASSSYQTVVTGSEFTGTVSGDGYVCEGVITTHTDKSLLDVSGVPVMYINIKDGEGNPTVETYRAAVNGKYYETLADAIDAANTVDGGATVTLLADVILGEKLTITGDVTIEGAYTITRADAYTGTLFAVEAGATLTLDGGLTIDGGNAWTYTVFPPLMDMDNGAGTTVAEHITPAEGGVNATAHMIVNNGTLNVHSVTIENSYSTGGFSLINAGANSVTILDGATIRHTAANRSGAVAYVGGSNAILTIKGTTRITDNFGVGNGGIIQNYGQGTTVNLEGGSIDNNFVGKSGTLYASYSSNADKINTFNMTGGIITENVMEGYGPVYIHTNTVWNMSGGEISENVSYLPSYVRNNNPAGSMTGGKIANNEITGLDYSDGYYLTHPDLRLNGKTAITGGIYSQNVFEYLAPNTGLAYDDGLYTVVSKGLFKLHLTDPVTGEPATVPYIEGNALASLVATGKLFYADYYEMTLEVLYDVKVDETVVIDYPMTIDLNGHTITGFSTMQSTPVFRVVSDVTVIGEGKVDGRPGSACYAFIVGQGENAGNLTIENGTFYGDTSAISVTKGTATINGGKFAVTPYQEEGKEDNYNFLLNCIDKNYKDGTAKIVVKGGTFYKFNPADNAAEGAGTSFVHENYLAEADGDYYTVRVNKDTLPTVADVVIKLEGGQTITLTYPSERFDTIQKLIGTNDYADFVLGAEQSELLAYVANGDVTDIVMNLYDDIELDAPINFYNKYFQVPVEYAITVNGNGHTISWADGYNGTLINVENGVSVTLKDLTIDGENAFTFYDDTTTVEDGQNWYTRFVDVGEEDKAINDNVIVNAGNLTLDSVRITGVTIASDGDNGKTANTETGGFYLTYNDDLALIKSNGGKVTINGGAIMYNAGMVLNAINAETSLNTNVMYNMGAGNKGGIIIANGGTMDIKGVITYNKAMARSATILGVINGAEVTFDAVMNYNEHIGVGSNTAGAMIVLEGASQFVMNGGTINYNEGGRAGAIASRWADKDTSIVLNDGSIIGNTASNNSWNGASIFLRSPATIGEGMTIDGTIAVNAAPGALEITGGTFTGSLTVTDGLTAEITGGTFDYDPTEWVAEGYEAADNGDGTYSVIPTKLALVEVEIMPGFWGTGYITVENWADLVAALGENTNHPVKVTLLKDIKLTDEGLTIAGTAKKVIDLNGHTITGMLVNYAELIVNDETQNGKIEGGPVAIDNYGALTVNGGFFTGEYGAIYNNELQSGKATVVIYGGEFTALGDWYATIENRYGVLTVNGGKIVATNRGGYAIVDTCGETTINGGEIVSADGIAVETYAGKIIINDGSFVGKVIVENQEGNVTVYGGTLVSNTPEYYYGMTNVNGGVTVLYGGTYERDYATAEGTSVKIAEGHVSVANGENFTVVRGSEKVLEIWDVDDLMTFAALANSGNNFSGWTVNLMADIDLGGMTWTPIASFAGNFVGNNHIISNFHIDATSASGGFFNVIASSNGLEDVKVKDLILSDVTATVGNARFGTLANSIQGVVHNVTVKNITVTTTHTNAWVGGMAAFMSWPWMTNCTVENLVVDATAGADLIGGFACILQKNSNHVFDNLDVKGFKVTVTDTDASGCGVGGFVAQTQRGWENPKIINSDITGIDITASGLVDVGGFIAWPGAHTIAENCHTSGKIDVTGVTSADCFAGGFFGNLGWNCDLGQMGHKVTGCTADVDIITKVAPAGGFVGSATNSNNNSMYATFNNCSASGDITAVEGATADIGGFFGDGDRGVYNNCSASGTVTNNGTGYAGQFGGALYDVTPKYDGRYPAGTRDYLVDEITLDGCYYTGVSDLKFIGNMADGVDVTIIECVATVTDADGNVSYYTTLQDAFAACTNGETITLLVDLVYDADDVVYPSGGATGFGKYDQYNPSIIYIGGTKGATDAENQPSNVNAVLDLNGHTITNNADAYLFLFMDNCKVTIKDSKDGDGIIGNTEYPVIWVTGTDTLVTIESGKYTTANAEGLLWSTHGGDLVIKGGEFSTSADDASLLIIRNAEDRRNPNYFVDGKATVTIYGGTFYGFDPEKMMDDSTDPFTEFDACADGYKSIKNGNAYTVVNYIEWIKQQLLLGNDVVLEKDIVVDGSMIESIPAPTNGNGRYPNYGIFNVVGDYDVTFDLNGHSITYNGHKDFEWNGKTYNSCTVAHGLFFANDGAHLTIVGEGDIIVNGVASGVYSASPDTAITIQGGNWVNNGCAECGATNLFLYASHGGELYIEGGRFEQALDSEGNSYLIVVHGGEYKNSVIDFSQTKIVVTGGTFVGMDPSKAQYFQQTADNTLVTGETVDTVDIEYMVVKDGDTYTVTEWNYEIWDWDDLKKLDAIVESGNRLEGVTVKLMADIDLYEMGEDGEPVTFNPIGANKSYFKGTFDGQGHTIKNMYQSGWALGYDWDNYGTIGLFAYLWDATVKNLTIENAECFVEGGCVGAIAGSAWGNCTFENVTVRNSTFATYNSRAGGIVGYTGGTGTFTFKDVTVDENTVIAGLWGSFDSSMGGIMGQLQSDSKVKFENIRVACRIDAYNDVTAAYKYYAYRMCGMLIGRVPVDANNKPILDNVTFVRDENGDETTYVNFGEWARYLYIQNNVNGYGWQRVQPGYTYGGVDIDLYPDANIILLPFTSLFGGQQYGSYGQAEHEDVIVNYPYEAAINGINYWTLADAFAAAKDGDTIVVLRDLTVYDELVVSLGENETAKSVTLDLNGKTLTAERVMPVIRVQDGNTVTVTGNGAIDNATGYVFILGASDGSSAGNLTIVDGTYHGSTSVASVTKGALTVLGGYFEATEYNGAHEFTLNCIDANYKDGTASIVVKGGRFYGFNPENNAAEGEGTNFVPMGYRASIYGTVDGVDVYDVVELKATVEAGGITSYFPGVSFCLAQNEHSGGDTRP